MCDGEITKYGRYMAALVHDLGADVLSKHDVIALRDAMAANGNSVGTY